jgi:hypothetical protein
VPALTSIQASVCPLLPKLAASLRPLRPTLLLPRQRPEIVPFRLTPNMLDGMGLAGYEGVFRRVAEVALSCIRGNKDMLISVLESFIHDPLVEWQSRKQHRAPPPAATAAAPAAELAASAQGGEAENQDGLRTIRRILERLDGEYNIGVEALPSKNGSNSSRARAYAAARTAAGGRAPPGVGLAIPGQVHRLLKEATNDENLALMVSPVRSPAGIACCLLARLSLAPLPSPPSSCPVPRLDAVSVTLGTGYELATRQGAGRQESLSLLHLVKGTTCVHPRRHRLRFCVKYHQESNTRSPFLDLKRGEIKLQASNRKKRTLRGVHRHKKGVDRMLNFHQELTQKAEFVFFSLYFLCSLT